jgi:hypothetical protein
MRQSIERCENKIEEILQSQNNHLTFSNSMNVEPSESREVKLINKHLCLINILIYKISLGIDRESVKIPQFGHFRASYI